MAKVPIRNTTTRISSLRRSDVPGVWLNRAGVQVDENGVAISFTSLKEKDDQRFADVLGKPVSSPAELLKAISMDPRQPMERRIDTAKAAAQYFDAKRMALQGAPADAPPLFKEAVGAMSDDKLDLLIEMLRKSEALLGANKVES